MIVLNNQRIAEQLEAMGLAKDTGDLQPQ
jgi:hypothetical protein